MFDYLSLTFLLPPDKEYIETHGKIIEDTKRSQMYKYMCELDKARVLYYPHKFKELTNARMPFTNIILNPKHFECYGEMEAYIFPIINDHTLNLDDTKISRVDIAADVEGINVKAVIAMLHIKGIKDFRIIKDTIYAGKKTKVRVYNKLDEIRYRLKKNLKVTEGEKRLLELHKELTRFEIAIYRPKMNLRELKENPTRLVHYFDKLNFIQMGCSNPCGVMQIMYKQINRRFRKQIELLQDMNLLEKIKETFIADVNDWVKEKEPF